MTFSFFGWVLLKIEIFQRHLNSFHPTIKFTMEESSSHLPFLDIDITLKDGLLETTMYKKPTDKQAWLHNTSCHPLHCKKNIPFNQMLRARRLCSDTQDFQAKCSELCATLESRGYNSKDLQESREKASVLPRSDTLTYKPKKSHNRVPFVITHNPANPPLRTWLKQEQTTLFSSSKMKAAMPQLPIVGERNSKTLRNTLMPSSLPPFQSQDENPGVFKCKGCVICREHLVEAKQFKSSTTGETVSIRHTLTCQSTNIIYVLFCSKCQNTQYVGETRNSLRTRFYLHRSDILKNKGTHVTEHFNSRNHSLQDMRCLPFEKVLSNSHEHRSKREKFWIRKLHTEWPNGLNTKT